MNTPLTRRNASTPIASIPSSLSTRSTPSVPPASTLYEPLLKSILARRFAYNVLSISAAAAWLLGTFWTTWQLGGLDSIGLVRWIANWASPSTLVYASLWWLFGSVPVAVLRKTYMNATRSPSLSPYQTLVLRASQHQYRKALLIVFVSSTSLTLCHSLMSGITGTGGRDDPKLGIWTGSKKHPFHLNGRLIYIFLAQASGAMLYWLRDVLRDRFDIQWMGHSNISKRTLSSLTSSVISMILLSAISTLLSLFIFGALRMLIFPLLYRIPILHDLLRPLMAHFFRPKYTISFLWSHFDLVVRAYLIVLSTHLIWDITSTMFDVAFSMPATATEGSKDSALILVSGVSCADSYFQLHAFYELCSLSSVSKGAMTKRTVIYADTKYNPTLWTSIVHRCLLLLGNDYQNFLRRGYPPDVAQASIIPAAKPSNEVETPSTSVIHGRAYKMPQASPIDRIVDTLSSDGPLTKALSHTTADSIGFSTFFAARSWPPITKSLIENVTVSKATASSKIRLLFNRLLAPLSRRGIADWWVRDRKDKAAQKALPNRDLDHMIVEVLGIFISHSLREDALGHVQRDIPRVLEAMVLYLTAIEEYQSELSTSLSAAEASTGGNLTATELSRLVAFRKETVLAGEWIDALSTALRTSISIIVQTFGDRLTSLRFPTKIASRLQSFVDYST